MSEVLLESTTDSTTGNATGTTMEELMEEMMERKIKIRIDQMEARQMAMETNLEQRQLSMARQVDKVTHMELIKTYRVAQVQSDTKEAESKLDQLNIALTIMTYKIAESEVVLTTLSHQGYGSR
jgi:hypothetical protein